MDATTTPQHTPDLSTAKSISTYLSKALSTNDVATIISALNDIAKARGMSQMARDTGIDRVTLYRALEVDRKPRLDTVLKILQGLGVCLSAAPTRKRST